MLLSDTCKILSKISIFFPKRRSSCCLVATNQNTKCIMFSKISELFFYSKGIKIQRQLKKNHHHKDSERYNVTDYKPLKSFHLTEE